MKETNSQNKSNLDDNLSKLSAQGALLGESNRSRWWGRSKTVYDALSNTLRSVPALLVEWFSSTVLVLYCNTLFCIWTGNNITLSTGSKSFTFLRFTTPAHLYSVVGYSTSWISATLCTCVFSRFEMEKKWGTCPWKRCRQLRRSEVILS